MNNRLLRGTKLLRFLFTLIYFKGLTKVIGFIVVLGAALTFTHIDKPKGRGKGKGQSKGKRRERLWRRLRVRVMESNTLGQVLRLCSSRHPACTNSFHRCHPWPNLRAYSSHRPSQTLRSSK